jgi:hypothetical protein
LPGGLPALEPKHSLISAGRPCQDRNDEVLPRTKEFQGDAEAKCGLGTCPQGEGGIPAAKRADAVMENGFASLTFARDANGNPQEHKAAVGRDLAKLLSISLYLEDADLLA